MARRWVASGAFVASVIGHVLTLACGALMLSQARRDRAIEQEAALRARDSTTLDVELPRFDSSTFDNERAADAPEAARAPPPPPAGGGPLERHPDTDRVGRGGSRATLVSATNLDSHIDPLNLETEVLTHLDRSQVQRLRTAADRRSWDDHRSTPMPMELTFLATGPGALRERRKVANAALGSSGGGPASPLGGAPGGALRDVGLDSAEPSGTAVAGSSKAVPLQGAVGAAPGNVPVRGAAVLLARPWVMRARPALPTDMRARPNDTEDSSQAVAARVASLIHASTIGAPAGPGVGGEPSGGLPGRSGSEGMGSHSTPSGFGPGLDALNDPGIQGFIAGLKQRVDEQLRRSFPDWAIAEGRSGHVIFELALAADGRLERVRMVRPSGIDEYDGNVLTFVRRIPSFGPLPKALGQRALITMSYDSLNHVVGREGPGPGSFGQYRAARAP